jgi:hypothetical protein
MARYLNYYRLFINAKQCFIVAFLTHARTHAHAHAQGNSLPTADSWLYYLLRATAPVVFLFGDFNLSFLEVFKKDFKLFSAQMSTSYIHWPGSSVDVVTKLWGEKSKNRGWIPY